jgi:hypothetical protein
MVASRSPGAVADALEAQVYSLTFEQWRDYLLASDGAHIAPRPLPACWCRAEPGTEAKIRVMIGRALAGRILFHPDDLPIEAFPSAVRETHRRGNGTDEHGGLRARAIARDKSEVDALVAALKVAEIRGNA